MVHPPGGLEAQGLRCRDSERGSTFMEIVIAVAILSFALTVIAGAFGTNLKAVDRAKNTNRAAHFVEETLDSLAETSYSDLKALNGNVLYNGSTAEDSLYRIDLSVTESTVDLLTIKLLLRNVRDGSIVSRFVLKRSKR
ncbi:MAG TPA: type II secretion system protein [Planctomycetes bacterium]|nr:type II secretion system protein [Planctomycetota bacterium]